MVEADLLGTSGGSEEHGGYGERRRRRRAPLGRVQGESRGGNGVQGKREAVEGVEASPWRREGVGEAATAKQEVAGALRARATPRLCSSSWQRRKRTREEEVGWAGWGSWAGSGGLHR